jgi:hypothetical protein
MTLLAIEGIVGMPNGASAELGSETDAPLRVPTKSVFPQTGGLMIPNVKTVLP